MRTLDGFKDPLDAFKDQAFYWEARRIRDEHRQRFGVGVSNVVSLDEYRRKVQRPPVDQPPLKPAS